MRLKLLKTFIVLLIFILSLITPLKSQNFEPYESGIANYPPMTYNQTNAPYRTFVCKSSQNTLLTNGLFVFSIMSFNYFVREAFCQKPVKNYTSLEMIISCSPNVYKLSYLYFDKGPNIFLLYEERTYTKGKLDTETVDITKWMSSVSFPLKSLVKKNSQKQYDVKAETFITGFSMFSDAASFNNFGKVKMDVVYRNVTIDDETKLWVPVAINLSTTRSVQKISFYTLIVIKEMISLNFDFETISFENQSSLMDLGSFSGLSQISVLVLNETIAGYQSLALNVSYNYTTPFLNATALSQKYSSQKIFNCTKSPNLNLKVTKLTGTFYRRCTNSTLYHYRSPAIPKEGKYYKIKPAFTPSLVLEATSDGKIKLSKESNLSTQIFYFLHRTTAGQRDLMIFNAATKLQIRCQTSTVNDALKMGPMDDSLDLRGVWNFWSLKSNNVLVALFECKAFSLKLGVMNYTVIEGMPLAQMNDSSFKLSEQFSIVETDFSGNTINVPINNSVKLPYKDTDNYFYSNLWSSGNSLLNPYSYYSIEEEICYDRPSLDSRLANTSLNNFSLSNLTTVLPYFMDVNKTLSQETIMRNSNLSLINTSTTAFAQGKMYGVCISRVTLNNFFTQINQGWTGFTVENLTSIILGGQNSTVNDSASSTQSKTEQKPLILMPNGCQKIKIIDISQMKYECQVCKETYILFQENNSKQNSSSSFNPKKCICEIGYFMNQSEKCVLCSSHPTNCRPQMKLTSSLSDPLSTKLSSNESRTLLATLQIINYKYLYSFMIPVEKILSRMIVNVNGQNLSGIANNCTQDKKSTNNLSLCLDIRIQNVLKAEKYSINISTNILPSEEPINSYLLINQTQILSVAQGQKASYAFQNVDLDDIFNNQSSALTSQPVSKVYFSKLQTFEIIVHQPFTVQKFVNTIEPVISSLNTSSSVVMLVAPFLMDKINFFSILQTNSLLYMMTFLKFDKSNDNKSQIQQVAQKLFIFRPEPFFKPFSLKTQKSDQNMSSYIQIPRYSTKFQTYSIFSSNQQSTLSYPAILYKESIPSLNFDSESQNYLSLTLNALVNMGVQILLMETLMFLVLFFCSIIKEKKIVIENGERKEETIKKKMEFQIKRHKFIDLLQYSVDKAWEYKKILPENQRYKAMLEKPIEWQKMPEIKESQKLTDQENSIKQVKISENQLVEPDHEEDVDFDENDLKNDELTLKQNLLFIVTGVKQKRLIFYSSFVMIQLISQSYLLYFELVKPLDPTSSDITSSLLNFVDMIFSMTMMFLIVVFPVFLINYEPLNLLKIVAIISKFGGYKFNHEKLSQSERNLHDREKPQEKQFMEKSYTYGEIYFHFCIIYYETILVSFSIAIGPSLFYQVLPILLYQFFKLVWMYKRLKILDKLKIIVLCIIFILSGAWDFIEDGNVRTNIIQNTIIWGMYIVLFIEFSKLLKFLIVFLMKSLRLKKGEIKKDNEQDKSLNSKKLIKQKPSQANKISIMDIQEEPTMNGAETKDIPQFQSDTLMIEKKREKLENLKQKETMLKEITKTRQTLQENLKYFRNRRKRDTEKNEEIQNK